jgi:hypothetical protein
MKHPAMLRVKEAFELGKTAGVTMATKRSAPIGTIWTLSIRDDWTPTAENINALPEPLRVYIHDLKTVCDPAGDVTELFRLQTENRMLRWECERLAAEVGEGPPPVRSRERR